MTAGTLRSTYGGRYVPETLMPALDELRRAGRTRLREIRSSGASYTSSPPPSRSADPLTLAARFAPGKRLWLKREDLLHTGAHKLNNVLGQALLARRLGKGRIVAETGAGQHGVATATVCARFGLDCVVYMGAEDMRRQAPNVERMRLLGAEVRPVEFGTRTLKEATSEAIRDWITNVETTHYLIGSCVGPAPYPEIVRELQSRDRARGGGADPRRRGSLAGGRGSRASAAARTRSGMFARLRRRRERAAGRGRGRPARRSLGTGRAGCAPRRTVVAARGRGRAGGSMPHSISAGPLLPGVGPEHAWLRDTGRAKYVGANRRGGPCRIPGAGADGGDPAGARAGRRARGGPFAWDEEVVLVCLSGRGDKDLAEVLAR